LKKRFLSKLKFLKHLTIADESTEVLYLTKKASNIYKWKEKIQKNTGRRRKVQVTKAAFKGLHDFVFFTAESLPRFEMEI